MVEVENEVVFSSTNVRKDWESFKKGKLTVVKTLVAR